MSYELTEVPERVDGGSRFALGTAPGGRGMHPSAVLGIAANNLAAKLEKNIVPATPPEHSIRLYGIVFDQDGRYILRDRGTVYGPRLYTLEEAKRPGRFAKPEPAGVIVDKLLLGESVPANDLQAFKAAREVPEFHGLKGTDLRRFSDAISRAIIVRAGLEPIHPQDLPQEQFGKQDLTALPLEREALEGAAA